MRAFRGHSILEWVDLCSGGKPTSGSRPSLRSEVAMTIGRMLLISMAVVTAALAGPAEDRPDGEASRRAVLTTAREVARAEKGAHVRARSLTAVCVACAEAGLQEEADSALEEALATPASEDEPAHVLLGEVARILAEAGLVERARAVAERIEDPSAGHDALLALASAHARRGEPEQAILALEGARKACLELTDVQGRAGGLLPSTVRAWRLGSLTSLVWSS